MVETTMTMDRWRAYEDEWARAPMVDDLVAGYLGFKPPVEPGSLPQDGGAMGPEEFHRWVKRTGGGKLGPSAV